MQIVIAKQNYVFKALELLKSYFITPGTITWLVKYFYTCYFQAWSTHVSVTILSCTMIRNAVCDDAASIAAIYNYYVLHSVITFEETPIPVADMAERIAVVQTKYPWLVYEENGIVIGYAYASQWKVRAAYRHTVETSIYLHPHHTGRKIGCKLYTHLIDSLNNTDIHAIIGGIALPNDASVYLHESMGFHKVAHFREVGFKFEKWVDVGYWQLIYK